MNPAARDYPTSSSRRASHHRRPEYPGARPEAAHLLRLRPAPRGPGRPDRPAGPCAGGRRGQLRRGSLPPSASPSRSPTSSYREFRRTGAIDRRCSSPTWPTTRRWSASPPRMALTAAEYLAFEGHARAGHHDRHHQLRRGPARGVRRQKEVPGRRGYPRLPLHQSGHLYERAGRQLGKSGSITSSPSLPCPRTTRPPHPRSDRLYHRGQIISPGALPQGHYPAGGRAASCPA